MTTGVGPFGEYDGARWAQQRSRAIFNAVNRLSGSVDEAVLPKALSYNRVTSLRTTSSEGPR